MITLVGFVVMACAVSPVPGEAPCVNVGPIHEDLDICRRSIAWLLEKAPELKDTRVFRCEKQEYEP